jgi:hypothetical protein
MPLKHARRPYPIALPVTYLAKSSADDVLEGQGETISVSRANVLFRSNEVLVLGQKIELRIEWPVLLDNVVPLQVRIKGSIADVNGSQALVRVHGDYEFMTRARARAA